MLETQVDYPSLKARKMLAMLTREPLGYQVVRKKGGSHRYLEAPGRPPLTFAWHDRATLPPGLVRKVLTKDVGLTDKEAEEILGGGRK